jgi:uncharacterized lipoprotein YajG
MDQTWRALRRFTLTAMLIGAAVLAGGCQRPVQLLVPLDYRPTNRLEAAKIGPVPAGQTLAVTVTDSRTEGTNIGKNIEKDVAVPILAQQANPDQFFRDALSRELANAGFSIATDPSRAGRTLHLNLRRFWTEESNLYRSTINADAELKSASGKVLWQGPVAGYSKRFGRSLSPENYQQAFSDATVDLVQTLLQNKGFLSALQTPEAAPRGRKPPPRR